MKGKPLSRMYEDKYDFKATLDNNEEFLFNASNWIKALLILLEKYPNRNMIKLEVS